MEENKYLIHNFAVVSGMLDKVIEVIDECNFQLGVSEDADFIDGFNYAYLKSFEISRKLDRVHDFVFGKSDTEKLN